MLRYEFTERQVENLKALIMDVNIKGAAAPVIVELLGILDNPVVEVKDSNKGKSTKEKGIR